MATETVQEIEKRFLLHGWTPPAGKHPNKIRQAYLGPGLRVRISSQGGQVLTMKTGFGMSRTEHNLQNVNHAVAMFLFEHSELRIEKDRYEIDGWEIDVFHGDLEGLVLAEFEMNSEDEEVEIPEWLKPYIGEDVTNSLTNQKLAHIARAARLTNTDETTQSRVERITTERAPFIVLTGPPGSGKSTALKHLQKVFPGLFYCVREAATLVFHDLNITRPSPEDAAAMQRFQVNLAQVQLALEDLAEDEVRLHGRSAIICDRGILDNAAYLPGGEAEMDRILRAAGMESPSHLASMRYAQVIILPPAPEDIYNRIRDNNPARQETYKGMLALNDRTVEAWEHSCNVTQLQEGSWGEVMEQLEAVIRETLNL